VTGWQGLSTGIEGSFSLTCCYNHAMRGKRRILIWILALGAAIVVADLGWGPHARLGPGRRLPNIELGAPDTSTVRLSDYAGKVLLLDFFASW
jgi:hypothetical protein